MQDSKEGGLIKVTMDTEHIPEFHLHGISAQIWEMPPNDAGSERTQINIGFHVSRRSMFYFWKVLLPLYLLTLLSFQVYVFHPRELEARVNTTATYFLAAFAMLYVVAQGLP
jgi:hypothetical protein